MRTILSHFHNEEYLLPWWLNHHKKYFDHGILVNQHSTDNSVQVIKEICPNWEIIDTRNKLFDCCGTDAEMQELESKLDGWRTTLNVTEFLCGDYSFLDRTTMDQFSIRSFTMIDPPENIMEIPSYSESLIEQKPWGYDDGSRPPRSVHKKEVLYRFGRHWPNITANDMAIFWYGWSPWTEQTKKRKHQIQFRIPEVDIHRGFGSHHHVNYDQLEDGYQFRAGKMWVDLRKAYPLAYQS